jgi:hypothetical protein
MSRFSHSRRAAFLKITSIVSSLAIVAGAALSVHSGHDLAFLATMVAILVAAKTGVDAYWAGVDARRGAER